MNVNDSPIPKEAFMADENFKTKFKLLTGNDPFPWQSVRYDHAL